VSSFGGVTFAQILDGRKWAGLSANPDSGPTRYRATVRLSSDADLATLQGLVSVATFRRPLGFTRYDHITQAGNGPESLTVPLSGAGPGASITYDVAYLLSVEAKGETKDGLHEADLDFALPETP
jgi:hypothetical protein